MSVYSEKDILVIKLLFTISNNSHHLTSITLTCISLTVSTKSSADLLGREAIVQLTTRIGNRLFGGAEDREESYDFLINKQMLIRTGRNQSVKPQGSSVLGLATNHGRASVIDQLTLNTGTGSNYLKVNTPVTAINQLTTMSRIRQSHESVNHYEQEPAE